MTDNSSKYMLSRGFTANTRSSSHPPLPFRSAKLTSSCPDQHFNIISTKTALITYSILAFPPLSPMHRLQKLALEQGIYPKVFHPETDFWLKRPRAKKYPRIWLIEVARVLPSTALLDGIDINFNQCPPKEWLPNNLTWITHDILSEPPRKLCEKYDVIHVQLFITILRDGNPVPMLQNLMKMLSMCLLAS